MLLSIEDKAHRTRYTGYFLLTVEIKDSYVMINARIYFDQPFENDDKTYENFRKIPTAQGND